MPLDLMTGTTGAAVFKTCNVVDGLILFFLFLCGLKPAAAEEVLALDASTLLTLFFSGVTTTAGR